jgi:hypothetical protein
MNPPLDDLSQRLEVAIRQHNARMIPPVTIIRLESPVLAGWSTDCT